jgi:hypothetical protein
MLIDDAVCADARNEVLERACVEHAALPVLGVDGMNWRGIVTEY